VSAEISPSPTGDRGATAALVTGAVPARPGRRPRPWAVVFWWVATCAVLVVLDDLTVGPAFWALSRLAGPVVAVIAIYSVYVPGQIYLVRQATTDEPGRATRFFLRRFDVERRSPHIARNERHVRSRVVGAGSALLGTLLIAGVLPPLLLWRQGYDRTFVRRLSVATAMLYATEFALLHGLLPASL
jgi:hypothetical protein